MAVDWPRAQDVSVASVQIVLGHESELLIRRMVSGDELREHEAFRILTGYVKEF